MQSSSNSNMWKLMMLILVGLAVILFTIDSVELKMTNQGELKKGLVLDKVTIPDGNGGTTIVFKKHETAEKEEPAVVREEKKEEPAVVVEEEKKEEPVVVVVPEEKEKEPETPLVYENETPRYASYKITADLIGGMGNKLWIFLSTLGIAQKIGARAVFLDDESFRMLDSTFHLENRNRQFTLLNRSSYSLDGFKRWDQGGAHDFSRSFESIDSDTVIIGYLQNTKFSAKDSDSFARTIDLEFKPELIAEARELMRELGSFGKETIVSKWVGLHVRRYPDRHTAEPRPSTEAMERQVNQVLQHCEESLTPSQKTTSLNNSLDSSSLSPCCALIFSNDPPWAQKYLTGIKCSRFVHNEFLEDPGLQGKTERNNGWATHFGRDMAAMTMCDSLVLTVGTFGYFSGILHGQEAAVQRRSDLHAVGDADGAPGYRSTGLVYGYKKSDSAIVGSDPSSWHHWG